MRRDDRRPGDTSHDGVCSKCRKTYEPNDENFGHRKNKYGQTVLVRYCRECERRRRRGDVDRSPAAPPSVRVEAGSEPPPEERVEPAREPTIAEHIQIKRLREELKRARDHARALETEAVAADGLRELIGSLGAPNVVRQPEWLEGAKRPRGTSGTAVALLSDVHFDEVVNPNEIGGCNEYGREVGERRLRNFFKSVVVLLKRHLSNPSYDGLVLNLGGDLLSGNIHEELVETNAATINQSMLALEEILLEGIIVLADEFKKIHVPCVTGNHGRQQKKPRFKQRAHLNHEWSIYQRLIRYLRNDSRITFDVPEGPDAMYDVYKRRYCLTHGDQFPGGGGIGGIMIPINRGVAKKQMRQSAINDPFDIILMGHWHQYIHTSGMVINGSVKGYDEYAFGNNFPYEPPQQALFIEHPEHGVTFRMPVLVDKES